MSTTQKQIAEHLGISLKSVTRALHGEPKVSDETRREILKTARKLGYGEHSNREARALIARRYGRRIKQGILAVLLGCGDDAPRYSPYFASLLDGIEMEASDRKSDTFLFTVRSNELPRLIQERGVDGVACLCPADRFLKELKALNLPLVTIGQKFPLAHSILPDEARGVELSVQFLLESGHRRIAYVGHPPEFPAASIRLKAYRAALEKNHAFEPELVEASIMVQQASAGAEATSQLLQRSRMHGRRVSFTAIVCYNDMLAMGVVQEVEAQGWEVPRDVSVVGFDDISLQHNFRPALTSIFFDRIAMGRRAVQLLSEQTDSENGLNKSMHHEIFPVELAVRDSTRKLTL